MPADDRELLVEATKVEALLAEIESFPDVAVRERVGEIVSGLLSLYGSGLERILEHVRTEGGSPGSDRILAAFTGDALVSHLLLLHDLHPVGIEARVAQALDEVRPLLESHGRSVECVGLDEGVARLRVQGGGGCPSTAAKLNSVVEQAVLEVAPDLAEIVTESMADGRANGFIPLGAVH
jgi:Fe-S cluster biogenesis protein NfuA